jgi:predicted dehydrogenase
VATTRTAIVGLGAVSGEHLAKLHWLDDVEVVGVCDRSASVAEAVATRFGVGPAFSDYATMLAATSPDVVHVLTPPRSHRDLVLAALDAGAHVLVEKPMATSWADYTRLRDAAARSDRQLAECWNYRFMGVVLDALDRVRDGAIGVPASVDVSMGVNFASGAYADRDVPHFAHELPGGALANFASHPASLLLAVMGSFEGVRAWRRRVGEASLSDDELRALVAGRDMAGTLTLTSRAKPSDLQLRIRGSEGTMDVDVYHQRILIGSPGMGPRRVAGHLRDSGARLGAAVALAGRYATARQDYFEGLRTLMERFYAAVAGRGAPPIAVAELDEVNRLVHELFAAENQL